MNRRSVIISLFVLAIPSLSYSAGPNSSMAQDAPIEVMSAWRTPSNGDGDIDRFMTTITNHGSEEEADKSFDRLLDAVQEGTIYNQETNSETIGDDSFFVRYNDPNFVTDEFVVRFGPLIYQFRAESVHYGGARDAFRLMEAIFSRFDETADSEEVLTALLPTEEEVAIYGLTEQVESKSTPAS